MPSLVFIKGIFLFIPDLQNRLHNELVPIALIIQPVNRDIFDTALIAKLFT